MTTPAQTKMFEAAKKFVQILAKNNIEAKIKVSRYDKDLKAVEIASTTPFDGLLKALAMAGEVTDLTPTEEKALSGKYKAKLITIMKPAGGLAKGDCFYMVNTFTEKGTLKTKDLAPEKLGLTKGPFKTEADFDKKVLAGIATLKVDTTIKIALQELFNSVSQNKSARDSVPMNAKAKAAMAAIKPQDRQAIGKDFGEILSMRWHVSQPFAKTWTECYFSSISNEALVDYTVVIKEKGASVTVNVSAKFEAGAAPSIGAIVGNLDEVYKKPTAKEKPALEVLKALAGDSGNTSAKILDAHVGMNLPAFQELQKVLGKKKFTTKDIHDHIQEIANRSDNGTARANLFLAQFSKFYKLLGKNASPESIAVVFSQKTYKKYYSLIMAPMGYALVAYLNDEPIYKEILNNLARAMKTQQVYLDFSKDALLFKKKLFSEASFKFAYGANAKDSDNTGIKFSMKL